MTGPAKVRAVIFDIYGTLLHTGPPPPDAAERWRRGCRGILSCEIQPGGFERRRLAATAAQHAERRAAGEAFPEVDGLEVIRFAAGRGVAFRSSDDAIRLSELHAACQRTCTAAPGVVPLLGSLRDAGLVLGLASNAQHYTLTELAGAGIPLSVFHPDLCFLSGEHGFAKPSPRVFTWISSRLAARGIAPHETLMIGDSMENDILPAIAAGWQTWQAGARGVHASEGRGWAGFPDVARIAKGDLPETAGVRGTEHGRPAGAGLRSSRPLR
jgi:FMN phosphatase YigB (HAD superfamily)